MFEMEYVCATIVFITSAGCNLWFFSWAVSHGLSATYFCKCTVYVSSPEEQSCTDRKCVHVTKTGLRNGL